MADRYGQDDAEDVWLPGEVRTFPVVNRDAGFVYFCDFVMTVSGQAVGPVNQRVVRIDQLPMTSPFRRATR
jgi:hypothetical protein